jgi:hypothetical protein
VGCEMCQRYSRHPKLDVCLLSANMAMLHVTYCGLLCVCVCVCVWDVNVRAGVVLLMSHVVLMSLHCSHLHRVMATTVTVILGGLVRTVRMT